MRFFILFVAVLCAAQTKTDLGSPIQSMSVGKSVVWTDGTNKHFTTWFDRADISTTQQLFDVNMTTGTSRVVDTGAYGRANQRDKLVGSDGNLYFGTNDPCRFIKYVPSTGAVVDLSDAGWAAGACGATTLDNASVNGAAPINGDNSKIFFGGYSHANVWMYDVTAGTLTDFGVMSPPCGSGCVRSVQSIRADANFAYVTVSGGGDQWLTIIDLSDSSQTDCFKGLTTSVADLQRRTSDGVLILDRYISGAHHFYEIDGSGACPVDELGAAPTVDPYYVSGNSCFYTDGGDACALLHGVDIDVTDIAADSTTEGVSTLRYRLTRGSGDWTTATGTLTLYPSTISRIKSPNLLSGLYYGPLLRADMESGTRIDGGSIQQSTYALASTGNYWLIAGYDTMFHIWDTSQTWTAPSSGTGLCTAETPTNPCYLRPWGEYHYFAAAGSDGQFYVGTRDNDNDGTILGWVNPATFALGSYRTGPPSIACYRPKDMISLAGGTLMALSGQGVGGAGACASDTEGNIFIFDVATQAIVDTWTPHAGAGMAGTLVELANGNILGVIVGHPTAADYTAYSINPTTGAVAWTVTGAFTTIFGSTGAESRQLARGPDGAVYFYLNNNLIRMSPIDGSVTTVFADSTAYGRLELIAGSQGWGFYPSTSTHLYRINLWRPAALRIRNSHSTATQVRLKYGRTTTLDATAQTVACAYEAVCYVPIPGHVIGDMYYQWEFLTAGGMVSAASDITKVTL